MPRPNAPVSHQSRGTKGPTFQEICLLGPITDISKMYMGELTVVKKLFQAFNSNAT